jgi:hypothetical protein
MFESNGLLDIFSHRGPLPDRLDNSLPNSGSASRNQPIGDEDGDFLKNAQEAERRSAASRWASPPPPAELEEEPDWEEEEKMIMRELEEEEEREALRSSSGSTGAVRHKERTSPGGKGETPIFIPSDIFGDLLCGEGCTSHEKESYGQSDRATASQLQSNPPPVLPCVFPVEAESNIPPLLAETASGSVLSFKRRPKPAPAPLIVSRLSGFTSFTVGIDERDD